MDNTQGFWRGMSRQRRWILAVGAVIILCVAGALAWWTMTPRYTVLFSGLRESSAAEIAGALDTMQVPHRYADGGATLLVPDDLVYDTRMKLVAQNVPHGSSVGFEVFKDSDFGVTEFAQQVNYQRALQGELERTIDTIAEVESARVHLTLRRTSMFDEKEEPSKASVSLTLRPGARATPAQVAGIQRLVASAVQGLDADSVVVLGDGGAVLAGGGRGAGLVADDSGQLEARLHQRIDALLSESLGSAGGWSVSVDVRMNFDKVKHIRDTLVPQGQDGNGLLTREKVTGGHASVSTDAQGNKTTTPGSGDNEREFAHSREQEEVEVAPGRVERISIGVMLPASVDAATVTKLTAVIGAAAGIDASRGDQLTIATLPVSQAIARRPGVPPPVAVKALPADADLFWWWMAGGILVAALLGAAAAFVLTRRKQPARLSLEHREEVLANVRQWLRSTEGA